MFSWCLSYLFFSQHLRSLVPFANGMLRCVVIRTRKVVTRDCWRLAVLLSLHKGKHTVQNSFFPWTIRAWNDLPECYCHFTKVNTLFRIASFLGLLGPGMTSLNLWFPLLNKNWMIVYPCSLLLWELGTNFPQSQPLVKECHFGVSQVNYSDSEMTLFPRLEVAEISTLWPSDTLG